MMSSKMFTNTYNQSNSIEAYKHDSSDTGSSDESCTSSKSSSNLEKHTINSNTITKKTEKKDKKHKKHKREKSDKSDKKKDKKHKKHKKEKKQHNTDNSNSNSLAINQNQYGKYGIIREEHFHQKQVEFDLYMEEVKGIKGILYQSKRDVMKYFQGFMEDYNTATMPREKYYNFEQWEMKEYMKGKHNLQNTQEKQVFNDEEEHYRERKRLKEEKEREEFIKLKNQIAGNRDQREAMRRQELLRIELSQAHRQGDRETIMKIEKLLAPDPKNETITKHPWS